MPADLTGTLTVNDPNPTAVSLQTPGQNAQYTFTLATTQQVTVHVTNNSISGTFPCVTVSVLGTSSSNSSCGPTFDLPAVSLAAGPYTVKVDPLGNSKGSLSLRVSSP